MEAPNPISYEEEEEEEKILVDYSNLYVRKR